MDKKSKTCHDLKTERSDVAPPLPAVASALPIAFYLACVGAVGLNLMFYLKTKDANEKADEFKQAEASEVRLRGDIVAQRESAEAIVEVPDHRRPQHDRRGGRGDHDDDLTRLVPRNR